jgi:hypothetical protein
LGVALLNAVSKQVLRKPLHEAIPSLCGTEGEISAKSVLKLKDLVTAEEAREA